MQRPRALFLFCFFVLTLAIWPSARAEEEKSEKEVFDDIINDMEDHYRAPPPREESTTLEKLEDMRDVISEDIENLASRIDSTFVNESVIYGRNTTNVRLFDTASLVEGDGASDSVDFKVRLQLPRLKDKLQFEVDRQLEDYSVSGVGNSTANNTLVRNRNTTTDRNTRAGFSLFNDLATIKTKVTGGMEYDHGLNPYARLRLSRDFKISRRSNIMAIANFIYEVQNNTSTVETLYYDFAVRNNILFRFINESTYKDVDHSYQTVHSLNIFQEVNDRNFLSYVAGLRGLNPGNDSAFYLSEYFVGTTLRHRLYKRFLFGELTPGVSWPIIKEFHSVLLFSIRLEVIFGQI